MVDHRHEITTSQGLNKDWGLPWVAPSGFQSNDYQRKDETRNLCYQGGGQFGGPPLRYNSYNKGNTEPGQWTNGPYDQYRGSGFGNGSGNGRFNRGYNGSENQGGNGQGYNENYRINGSKNGCGNYTGNGNENGNNYSNTKPQWGGPNRDDRGGPSTYMPSQNRARLNCYS